MDLDGDFRIDREECRRAKKKGLDPSEADLNGDGVVKLDEYLEKQGVRYEAEKAKRILGSGIFSEKYAFLKEHGLGDKYEALGVIISLYSFDDKELGENLRRLVEVAPEFVTLGLGFVDIAGYLYRYTSKGDVARLLDAIEATGVASRKEIADLVGSMLKKNPGLIRDFLEDGATTFRAMHDLGFGWDEIKKCFETDASRMFYLRDAVAFVRKYGIFSDEDLKKLMGMSMGDNGAGLRIFSFAIEGATQALRRYKFTDAEIREVLLKLAGYQAGGIAIYLPEVLAGLESIGISPREFIMEAIEDLGPSQDLTKSIPFTTFGEEGKWLADALPDPAKRLEVVKGCFSRGVNFRVMRALYDGLSKFYARDEAFEAAMRIATGFNGYFDFEGFKALTEYLEAMAAPTGVKGDFLMRFLKSGNSSFSSLLYDVIKPLRERGLSDDDILSISFDSPFVTHTAFETAEVISLLNRLNLYQTPDEVNTFLNVLYFDSSRGWVHMAPDLSFKLTPDKIKCLLSDPAWPEARSAFGYTEILDFLEYTINSGYFDGKRKLTDVIADCAYLKERGISRFGRYPAKVVDRMRHPDPKMKNVLLMTPYEDHNGAFNSNVSSIERLVDGGFNIDIVEAMGEEDLYGRLAKHRDGSISYLILSGHGNPRTLSMREFDRQDSATIDLTDEEDFVEHVFPKLKDGAMIILASCSTGQELAPRIAEWARKAGKKIEVIAPPVDVSSSWTVKEGRIHVTYSSDAGPVQAVRISSHPTSQPAQKQRSNKQR